MSTNPESCPTCEDEFDTERAMKIHHTRVHGESIAGVEKECKNCGDAYRVKESEAEISSFCSGECRDQWRRGRGRGRVDLVCEYCGCEYTVWPAKAESSRFCSTECFGDWRRENESKEEHPAWKGGEKASRMRQRKGDKECSICGERGFSPLGLKFHRSMIHGIAVSITETDCDYCGDTVRRDSYMVKRSERTFCSRRCHHNWMSEADMWSGENHPTWDGGGIEHAYYGSNWGEIREEVIHRDGHECVCCGVSRQSHREKFNCDLDVHHREKVREFESLEKANSRENLVTLCSQCHQLWERLPVQIEVR